MLIVTGVIEIAEADAEAAVAAAVVMQRETQAEDGCIEYRFWRDLERPGVFRVYEEWRDRAALEAHFVAPHMKAFGAALAGLTVISRDVRAIEAGAVTPLS